MFSLEQYRALLERTAVLDRADRGRLELTGNDRRDYLHGLLTNDIAALKVKCGPPFSATKSWPSSLNATVMAVPGSWPEARAPSLP